jgi:hypothetical protein
MLTIPIRRLILHRLGNALEWGHIWLTSREFWASVLTSPDAVAQLSERGTALVAVEKLCP